MKTLFFLLPLIGALTGWVIITVSLKILFWPRNPARTPFNFTFQGVLPKKQVELAEGIGEIVKTQIRFAVTDDSGVAPEILERLTGVVVDAARERLNDRIPALVPKGIKYKIAGIVEDIIRREIPGFVDTLADQMRNEKESETDICRWAEERIREYDLSELETKISSAGETRGLKLGAAAIGFISGLIQLFVVWLVLA